MTHGTIKYAVIPADLNKPVEFKQAEPTLDLWQEVVGGYIEPVVCGAGLRLWVDEEGKLKDKPRNARATALAKGARSIRNDDYLAGDVAVYGGVDDEGECTGLMPEQAELLRAILREAGTE